VSAGRRRGVALLAVAVACGGLAASEVRTSVRRVQAQVGPTVPVVVAREDLDPGTKLGTRAAARALAVRQVPESFVPADSLAAVEDAIGARTAAPLPSGAFLTQAHLEAPADEGPLPALTPGDRVVQIPVSNAQATSQAGPETLVDVVVTTESRAGGAGRSYVALERVQLLGLSGGDARDMPGAEAGAELAALRVTSRQAVMLTAAANFAREVRLLVRPPGDRSRVGRVVVDGSEL
jgi:Flp pilus assembly protein CpaB